MQRKFQIPNIKYQIVNPQNIFLLLTTLYLILLIHPALLGQLGGTFKPSPVPQEYIQLKDFLVSQEQFSRTFWVPQKQRFGYTSNNHPAINAQNFFDVASISGLLTKLNEPDTKTLLENAAVKYVIVPYDSKGEIFLTDREYDRGEYIRAVEGLEQIDWLHENVRIENIVVFELVDPKDHFFTLDQTEAISWERMSATEYEVRVSGEATDLIFSEGYDPGWIASVNGENIRSVQYKEMFNYFPIPEGSHEVRVIYTPQTYVLPGFVVSGITFVSVAGAYFFLRRRSR